MSEENTTAPLSKDKESNLMEAENGEAKYTKESEAISLTAKGETIGLTKEQLEQFRNDPFWKTLRLTLFVLFWLAWIAMFVGAILIVILSPKCVQKKQPEWWKTKISYQVFTPSFRDSDGNGIGDFKGVEEKLDDLRKIGIQNIWLTPVIKTQKDDFMPYDVVDFDTVDERFGTMQQFQELISAVHEHGMYFVMDLPIATTSSQHIWFEDAKKGGKYRKFYIWKKKSDVLDDKNYVSVPGTDDVFLAYNGRDPILNWENEEVKKAMIHVAQNYLEAGVDGFHLAYIHHLMKSQATAPQAKAALAALESFNQALDNYVSDSQALKDKHIVVFCTMNDMEEVQPRDDEQQYNLASMEYVIDDGVAQLDSSTCQDGVARCLYNSITKSLRHFERTRLPHIWQFTNSFVSRKTSRFDQDTGNLMTFIQMTLPGAVEIYYGQEIGLTDAINSTRQYTGLMQWDSTQYAGFTSGAQQPFYTNTPDYEKLNFETQYKASASPLKTFKTLAKLRQRDENIAFAAMTLTPFASDLIMYTRIHRVGSENAETEGPAYIVVSNFGAIDRPVDVKPLIPEDRSAADVSVVAMTSNCDTYYKRQQLDLSAHNLMIGPKQGILLRI